MQIPYPSSHSTSYLRLDLRSIAVAFDDVTVVAIMFGPIDIDSLEFQTRVQIRQIQELTGESWAEVVAKAVAQRYYRIRAAAEYLSPAPVASQHGNNK